MNASSFLWSRDALALRCERLVHSARARWAACMLAGAAGLTVAIAASFMLAHSLREVRVMELKIRRTQEAAADSAKSATTVALIATPTDFAHFLPASIDIQPVLAEVQRAAFDLGLVFSGVTVQHRAPTAEQLARSELTVSLRGSYPKLKQLMAAVLDRFPNATLSRLTLRKTPSATDLDATMALLVWGAPLPLAAGASAPVAGR